MEYNNKYVRGGLRVGMLFLLLLFCPGCSAGGAQGMNQEQAAYGGAQGMNQEQAAYGGAQGINQSQAASSGTQDMNQGQAASGEEQDMDQGQAVTYSEITFNQPLDLVYANQFSVTYSSEGYAKIQIKDIGEYLLVPPELACPQQLPQEITVLQQPLDKTYLTATSAMDLIVETDALDQIAFSGIKESDWYIEEARQAMEAGTLRFGGKYNMPDYELLLAGNCNLAIASTMILHNPEVKEQLEQLGIPVLVEHSSYESHPLGRMEWIRLYGILFQQEQLAERCFAEELEKLRNLENLDTLDPSEPGAATELEVAFFYITSNGAVNVRKGSDYVSQMIEMAGGNYIFSDLEENGNALSTMNMQMEAFYAAARDVDIIIYNSAIDGEIYAIEDLLQKEPLLADFKAVQNGQVFCTGKNLFQESMGIADFLVDLYHLIENPQVDEQMLTYLHRVK